MTRSRPCSCQTLPDSSQVLLIHLAAEDTGFDITWRIRDEVLCKPPLGLLYLAAALRLEGCDPLVLDESLGPLCMDDVVALTRRNRPLFIGFTSTTITAQKVCHWIRMLSQRLPDTTIVVGGPGATRPEPFLEAGADFVFRGEADLTIRAFVRELRAGSPTWEKAPGLVFRRGEETVDGGSADVIRDLDALPVPAWDLLPVGAYHDRQIPGLRKPYFTMITSRGCRYRCAFCATRGHWRSGLRVRSARAVVEEIDLLVQRHCVRYVGFHDDLFGDDDDWVEEFATRLAQRPYKIRWAAMAHPLSFSRDPEKKLSQLRRSGCDFLAFGLQSAHPDVMRAIHRSPREPDVLRRVVGVAAQLGIFTKIEFILGLPGEPPSVDEQYLRYALDARPNTVKFFRLLILDGTELMDKVREGTWKAAADGEIDERCARAMRRFYTNPRILAHNVKFMLRRYPDWPLRMLPHAGFLLEAVGLRGLLGRPRRQEYLVP